MSSSSHHSYSSTSYTTTSSSNGGPPVTRSSHEQVHSTSTDGTTIARSTAETGKPSRTETTYHPPTGNTGITGGGGGGGRQIEQGRVEELNDENESEADRKYRENIEDEYAKREGGA